MREKLLSLDKGEKSENIGLSSPILQPKKNLCNYFLYIIFCFKNLTYKWIKQFENQQEGDPIFLSNVLAEVRVVFLPDCPLVLSLLKHMGVETFLNKKKKK